MARRGVRNYAKAREAFDRSTVLGGLNRERVETPLGTGTMPALYTCAPGARPVTDPRNI